MSLALPIQGSVLRIERSSIHDGQGLRTVIFLKGCPLKCSWCSTPESQNAEPERGYIQELCHLCLKCLEACPNEATSLDKVSSQVITSKEKCSACFSCASVCPANAIRKFGFNLTVDETIREISRDEIFYFYSGGGVTISGGEPLSQINYVVALLKNCRRLGIHTAVESCYYLSFDIIRQALPWLDLLYVDIKQMDSIIHEEWTGKGNELILGNIKKSDLSDHLRDLVIRIPLIPGFNDSDLNLKETVEFCSGLRKIKAIEILPYHRLGSDTYRHLGLKYLCRDLTPPSSDYLAERVAFLNTLNCGIPIRTGSGFI